MQIQVNMEMRFTRRALTVAVAVAHHGTVVTLNFLSRAILSSCAEAVTVVVRVQARSVSTTAVVIATVAIRSVRSWSHFDVTRQMS